MNVMHAHEHRECNDPLFRCRKLMCNAIGLLNFERQCRRILTRGSAMEWQKSKITRLFIIIRMQENLLFFFFFKFILKVDPKASIDHINVPCELHRNPFVTLSLQPLRNLSEMAM